jgi:hypothetical protein
MNKEIRVPLSERAPSGTWLEYMINYIKEERKGNEDFFIYRVFEGYKSIEKGDMYVGSIYYCGNMILQQFCLEKSAIDFVLRKGCRKMAINDIE